MGLSVERGKDSPKLSWAELYGANSHRHGAKCRNSGISDPAGCPAVAGCGHDETSSAKLSPRRQWCVAGPRVRKSPRRTSNRERRRCCSIWSAGLVDLWPLSLAGDLSPAVHGGTFLLRESAGETFQARAPATSRRRQSGDKSTSHRTSNAAVSGARAGGSSGARRWWSRTWLSFLWPCPTRW